MELKLRRHVLFVLVGALWLCAVAGIAQGRKGGARRSTSEAVLPAGTTLEVRLASQIHSGEANNGDRFDGTLAQPVTAQGRTMARGTRVTGRVIEAVSSGRLKRPASLTLELVEAGGVAVRTNPITLDGKSHAGRNAALIGGGAAAGAIIGAIAGGGKGAAIGAATGAGAGVGVAYMTGKQELVLPPEMLLQFAVAGSGSGVSSADSDPRPYRRDDPRSAQYEDPQVFSANSRRVIGDYLRVNRSNLPPGLARRERLPPGLERQLQRNGTLPPGLQKRVEPFPADLDRQLPRLPRGMSRVFLGGRALLLDSAHRILDMFTVDD